MDLGLRDATVVVAGGTSGMGHAAARCFAEDGARVRRVGAITGCTPDDGCRADRTRLSGCDRHRHRSVRHRSPVNAAIAGLGDRWGHLNALVNAAGPMRLGLKTFETYADEEWHDVFDGLAMAAVRTIRAALPLLRAAEWARIVNVSAMLDEDTNRHHSLRIPPPNRP